MARLGVLIQLLGVLNCCFAAGTAGEFDHGNRHQRQKRADDPQPLEAVVAQLTQEVQSLKADLQTKETELKSEINDCKGSTFVRWGRSQCPATAQLVYTGVVGGSWWDDAGGEANRLCLTLSPKFDTVVHGQYSSEMYGGEYESIADQHNNDIVCAVCRASHPTTVMIPGTNTCPENWTFQYSGHIVGDWTGHTASTEYLCLDSQPEGRPGTSSNMDGTLAYYTVAHCGSLPCPPYINDKVLTCVVCSK